MSSIEDRLLTLDGQTVALLQSRATGDAAKPAVVLVHGIGGRKEDWTSLIGALSGTHRVYAFDMIGFGASDKSTAEVTITQQALVVAALLDHEGLAKASVVGNSLGAWVAATFAVTTAARVERLVLADAAGLKVTLAGPPPVNFAPDTVDDMAHLLHTVLLSPFARTREFAEQALVAFKAGGEAATLGKLFKGFADPASPDRPLDVLLPLIQAPTLVAWGAQDGLFPVALADVVIAGLSAQAGARKHVVPNASHFPHIDNPQDFNAAVAAFLR